MLWRLSPKSHAHAAIVPDCNGRQVIEVGAHGTQPEFTSPVKLADGFGLTTTCIVAFAVHPVSHPFQWWCTL